MGGSEAGTKLMNVTLAQRWDDGKGWDGDRMEGDSYYTPGIQHGWKKRCMLDSMTSGDVFSWKKHL